MCTYADKTYYETSGNVHTSSETTWNKFDENNFSEIKLTSTFTDTKPSQMKFKEFLFTRQKFKEGNLHKFTKQTIYTYYAVDGSPFLGQKIFVTLRFDNTTHLQQKNVNEIENHWPQLNQKEQQIITQKFNTETGELRKIESIIILNDECTNKQDWKVGDRFVNIPTILS